MHSKFNQERAMRRRERPMAQNRHSLASRPCRLDLRSHSRSNNPRDMNERAFPRGDEYQTNQYSRRVGKLPYRRPFTAKTPPRSVPIWFWLHTTALNNLYETSLITSGTSENWNSPIRSSTRTATRTSSGPALRGPSRTPWPGSNQNPYCRMVIGFPRPQAHY